MSKGHVLQDTLARFHISADGLGSPGGAEGLDTPTGFSKADSLADMCSVRVKRPTV